MDDKLSNFRFRKDIKRPNNDLIKSFEKVGTSAICDAMGRRGAMKSSIKPIFQDVHIVGSAITVWLSSADNLMLHKALDIAEMGDVIVVDANGNTENGPWGEILSLIAIEKGIKALVIDGATRDVSQCRQMKFPIFNSGVSPNGTEKDGPGEVNYPIVCGGVKVEAGDIIIADDDGVVAIPQSSAKDVLEMSKKILLEEERRKEKIKKGHIKSEKTESILLKKGIE